MTISLLCPECDHEWDERVSKAGRSVECPECHTEMRAPRPEHGGSSGGPRRPVAKQANTARTLLIGGSVVLLGIVAMVGLRMSQIKTDDNVRSAEATQSPEDTGSGVSVDTGGVSVAQASLGQKADEGNVADAVVVTPVTVTVTEATETKAVGTAVDAPSGSRFDDPAIGSAVNTDRGRELMAGITSLGLRVTGFRSDVRGAVSAAVKTAVTGAIEQCQVSVRAPNVAPVMLVELQLRDKKLVISAALIAGDQQELVRVWERSGTVTALGHKATSTGILPMNLQRDVASFFKSLRSEFHDARRQFSS